MEELEVWPGTLASSCPWKSRNALGTVPLLVVSLVLSCKELMVSLMPVRAAHRLAKHSSGHPLCAPCRYLDFTSLISRSTHNSRSFETWPQALSWAHKRHTSMHKFEVQRCGTFFSASTAYLWRALHALLALLSNSSGSCAVLHTR